MGSPTGLAAVNIAPYEGLIFTTARKFAGMAGMEEEDMRQELRLKAAQSIIAFDKKRSDHSETKISVKNFVFGCLTNRVTDLRKAQCRKLNHGVGIRYIEDFGDIAPNTSVNFGISAESSLAGEHNRFDLKYFHVDHDQVFGRIDEGEIVLPTDLTETERSVMLLLTLDMTRTEIAVRLGITRPEAFKCVESLREKFHDWDPRSRPDDCSVVKLADIAVAA
jgi:DNA-directed RNA polymerase specialized sigma24 family protein